jgi:hypothetical protein
MSADNTANGPCSMPAKKPQDSGVRVLPKQPTTGAATPAQPNVSSAQPMGMPKADVG